MTVQTRFQKPIKNKLFWSQAQEYSLAFLLLVVIIGLFSWRLWLPELSTNKPFVPQTPGQQQHQALTWEYYLNTHYTWQNMRQGHLPLLNPYLYGGAPHLANGENAVWEINKLLLYQLPIGYDLFWKILVFSRLLGLGFFTFLYLKALKLRSLPAVFGSLAFGLSAYSLASMGTPNLATIVWLPFCLWAVERYLSGYQKKYLFAQTLGTGLLLISGSLANALICFGFWFFYTLFRVITHARHSLTLRKAVQIYLDFLLYTLLGFCLAGPQLITHIELLTSSNYLHQTPSTSLLSLAGDLGTYAKGSWENIKDLLLFLTPYASRPSQPNLWLDASLPYYQTGLYIGLVSISLVFIALVGYRKKKLVWFLLLSALLSLGLGLNLPGFALLKHFPIWQYLDPTRFKFLAQFTLCILSAQGLDYLMIKIKGETSFGLLLLLLLVFDLHYAHGHLPGYALPPLAQKEPAWLDFLTTHSSDYRILDPDNYLPADSISAAYLANLSRPGKHRPLRVEYLLSQVSIPADDSDPDF